MRFIMTYSWRPTAQQREEGIARFRKGLGQPGTGAKLIGRWTRADLSGGFELFESNDVKALADFALKWNDLMELSLTPVLDDAELGEVFSRK
jgi:hypothetical protein